MKPQLRWADNNSREIDKMKEQFCLFVNVSKNLETHAKFNSNANASFSSVAHKSLHTFGKLLAYALDV